MDSANCARVVGGSPGPGTISLVAARARCIHTDTGSRSACLNDGACLRNLASIHLSGDLRIACGNRATELLERFGMLNRSEPVRTKWYGAHQTGPLRDKKEMQ